MKLYRLKPLPGDYAAAQAVGYDADHASGGWTITAFNQSPRFVGNVAQEYRELMRERKRQGLFAAPAFAAMLAVSLLLGAPVALAVGLAIVAGVAAYVFSSNESLDLEIWSHATTVRANVRYDGLSIDVAERQSASSLSSSTTSGASYGYAGQSEAALIAAMRAWYPEADAWLAANDARCRAWLALKGSPTWPL